MEEAGAALDASDKAAVEEDLKALKETIAKCGDELTDDQLNDLKAGREKLMASAQKLFEKLYQQQAAQQQGQGGPQPGPGPEANAGGSADDDVVDGDFREV